MDVKTFINLISDANIILLGKPSLKYFGILSYGIEKQFFTSDSSIFNVLPDYCKNALAWTDGKTMSFVARDNVTVEELNFDILHEISHIIMGHIKRMGSRDPELWCMATDHVVNRNIMMIAAKAEGKDSEYYDYTNLKEIMGKIGSRIYIPTDIVFLEDIHAQFPEATAEHVYYLLEEEEKNSGSTSQKSSDENEKEKEKEETEGDSQGNGESEGESENNQNANSPSSPNMGKPGSAILNSKKQNQTNDKSSNKNRFKVDSQTIELDGKQVVVYTVKDKKTGKTYNFTNDSIVNEDVDISECDELKERAKSIWHSKSLIFSKGDYPGDFVSFMDTIYKIEIPWNTLCESAILYPIQASRGRTWAMPNFYFRRFAKVPGKRTRSLQKKLFVTLIDSSGSISDNDLNIFTGIILDSIKHFDGLVILVHDVKIQQEFYFDKKPNETKVFESIREIKGRGGTSHGPVFKRVQEFYDGNESISIVMSLTDYVSDVEHIHKSYSWIFNTPMIWAITSKKKVVLSGTEFKQIYIPPDLSTLGKLK